MPGGAQFLQKFKAKFNGDVELFAPMGYDAVMVFVDAMKRAGSTDPAKFLPEIGKTNYQGVIGPIAFDDKGDLKNGPITIYVVKGGKWEPLETVTPGEAGKRWTCRRHGPLRRTALTAPDRQEMMSAILRRKFR